MKKSLIVLAVAAAIPALASAQSNVIMYGKVDLGFVKSNAAANVNGGSLSLNQGNGSRLGFRGSEDLGGGVKANFQIEHRFTADTGTVTNNNFWQGRSWVGLSGGFGEIRLGREYTPSFFVALAADPWGWGYFRNGDGLSVDYTHANVGNARQANAFTYISPSLGGFQAQLQVGLKETTAAGRGNNIGFSAVYAGGPVYVGLGYQKNKNGQPVTGSTVATPAVAGSTANPSGCPAGTTSVSAVSASVVTAASVASANTACPASYGVAANTSSLVTLTGKYDLGFLKLYGNYNTGKPTSTAAKNKAAVLGLTAPLGAGELRFAYSKLDVGGGTTGDKKIIAVGYGYNLSKRTELYTDFAQEKPTGLASRNWIDFGINHNF
jgi:predicted porin